MLPFLKIFETLLYSMKINKLLALLLIFGLQAHATFHRAKGNFEVCENGKLKTLDSAFETMSMCEDKVGTKMWLSNKNKNLYRALLLTRKYENGMDALFGMYILNIKNNVKVRYYEGQWFLENEDLLNKEISHNFEAIMKEMTTQYSTSQGVSFDENHEIIEDLHSFLEHSLGI